MSRVFVKGLLLSSLTLLGAAACGKSAPGPVTHGAEGTAAVPTAEAKPQPEAAAVTGRRAQEDAPARTPQVHESAPQRARGPRKQAPSGACALRGALGGSARGARLHGRETSCAASRSSGG